jgi:hypothetical protein
MADIANFSFLAVQ